MSAAAALVAPDSAIDPSLDQYLFSQVAPPQKLEVNAEFYSVRLVTPIGRLSYANLAKARVITNPDKTVQPPKYTATLLMNPKACNDIWKAICIVANLGWPKASIPAMRAAQGGLIPADHPSANDPSAVVQVTGEQLLRIGMLHSPLRRGDETYMSDPVKYKAYRATFHINGSAGEDKRPVCVDEKEVPVDPAKLYSGCYARLYISLFAFPKPGQPSRGKRGVGVGINAVQFAQHGEKLSGFDMATAARNAFGNAGPIPASSDGGFGANKTGSPYKDGPGFAAPVGGALAGGVPDDESIPF